MRKLLLTGAFLAFAVTAGLTQDCKVLLTQISMNYTGDCKSGKAEGKGKAVGQDTYDGEFKSGYPDGLGTYTWKEGSWFNGSWKKGQKDGQGEMHYKRENAPDSILKGFWKKDIYQGQYEKPYRIISQSGKISTLKITRNPGYKDMDIAITITNTTGGQSTVVESGTKSIDLPKLKMGDIDVQRGNFTTRTSIDNTARETKTMLRGVEFPFRATFRIDDQMFEVEFFEAGNYTVTCNILI